jgi:hypothetical protein
MVSDGHGEPPVLARHEAPVDEVDIAEQYGIWRIADALFACAFEGTRYDSAVGNTAVQRFMETWSDGGLDAELQVLDDAAT